MAKKEEKNKKTVQSSNKSTVKSAPKKTVKDKKSAEVKDAKIIKETKEVSASENGAPMGKTILAAILIILLAVCAYFGYQAKNGGFKPGTATESYKATEDEKRFKEEYESINGTERSNGQKNKAIEIAADNNVKYISIDEAATILEEGSGLIYFGFSSCPWCRNAAPVLVKAMASTSLDTIYYVDVRPNNDATQDIRDTFTLNAKNQAKRTKEASSKAYYDALTSLADFLSDYTLTTSTGKKVSTGEKRIGAPTVVTVKNGVVLDVHIGTYEGHAKDENGALPDLTKEQEDDLFTVYTDMISKYLSDSCGTSADSNC